LQQDIFIAYLPISTEMLVKYTVPAYLQTQLNIINTPCYGLPNFRMTSQMQQMWTNFYEVIMEEQKMPTYWNLC